MPYFSLDPDGRPNAGLQFVSFQRSLDYFEVIFQRWMLNPNFPSQGVGTDHLFASGTVTIEKAGFYFVPPSDSRFVGAPIFDPARAQRRSRRTTGRLRIRKRILDPSGTPALVDLAGIGFQVLAAADRSPIGEVFRTDSAGHATSPELPLNSPFILVEVEPPPGASPPAETQLQLDRPSVLVRLDNQLQQPGAYTG